MKSLKAKKFLALLLAASMMVPSLSSMAAESEDASEVKIPDPYYEFTFDEDGDGTDNSVKNKGSAQGVVAKIEGNKNGLGIIKDEVRGNNVLNLPGGDTNGATEGRLTLPEGMFKDVTDDGFAFSFWINIDGNASQYSRIFSATVDGQNSDNGYGNWNAPEFAFVAGSDTASDMGEGQGGYNTTVLFPDNGNQAANKLYLVWDKQFSRDAWQHVTISVSIDSYNVYLDGQPVSIKYDRNNNTKDFLKRLFDNNAEILKKYKYCAIGASVYKTDKDLKAKMDEFRFYNTALTDEQAKAAYDSYAVSDDIINSLKSKVEEFSKKSISFYTRDSYESFQEALSEAEKGIDNPVTEINVKRLIENLETTANNLVFYEGVDSNTSFSNAQLQRETAAAREILDKGELSQESETAIYAAVEKAEDLIATGENAGQKNVDNSLIDLRKAVDEISYCATLNFDTDPAKKKNEVFHGSTGFLYGVSEVGVPSTDLLSAISPKILVQKAANGQQHPSGDGYRLTNYLKSCGVENIQIYLQDYYLEWPYEYNGIDDYNAKVEKIVSKMVEGLNSEELSVYSFVLFNEPDGIWYGNDVNKLCNDWKQIYTTVKSINPSIKVAGPNYSVYNRNAYRTFFEFCKNNNCLPEYITWHELQKDKLETFKSHCDEVKQYIETYYKDSDIEPIIFINETVNFDDVGNPGALVNWLSIFDEEDVYASLPYWGLANSMNELAADTNKPNGAWWVYKWYAQMTGTKAPLELENIGGVGPHGRLYGLTSVDEQNSTIHSLFGGQKGKQRICIKNIRSTDIFKNADKAHVKIYSTKYTGHHGFADEIPVDFEGNLVFSGDDLSFTITDAELMDAYYAIITPATEEEVTTIGNYKKNWEQTYEAENATMIGGATVYKKEGGGDLARSNRAEVGGMNSENDGVKFSIEVPEDGKYRLNIYYTSQAPQVDALTLNYVDRGGQNRAIGALSRHTLTIDGGEPQEIVYDSTVKWGYYNYKTMYLDLTAGKHELTLMYKGESQNGKDINSMLCALLDKIDLSYVEKKEHEICIEPEELVGIQEGFSFSQDGNYTGAGNAAGSGDFDFYVNVPEDGFYSFTSKGSGNATLSKSRLNYAEDAKAESEITVDWMKLCNMVLGKTNQNMIYLTAGINHLCLTGNEIVLDEMVFTKVSNITEETTIEAEDCQLSGQDTNDGYNYLPGSVAVPKISENSYASGGKVVEGFRGGKDNLLSLTIDVPEAGDYKLSVYYSNNEPAPVMKKQNGDNYVHPYNTDLVERYMQISVNGGTSQTVYFRNTLCWDTFRNTILDVKLQKGSNTITFTNDNSYKFSSVQDDFTPRLDKFVIAPSAIINPEEIEEAVTPIISEHPISAKYTQGNKPQALTVKASVSDNGTLSYQWYKNTKNSTEGATIINGAVSASYTPSTEETGIVYYYCKVTNTKGTSSKEINSAIADITVNAASVAPTLAPTNAPVQTGKPAPTNAPVQYTITYAKDSIRNAKISASIISKDEEFESGSKVAMSDQLKLIITPENGYAFAGIPEVIADNAIVGEVEAENGVYTFIIHTFKGNTNITVNAKTARIQYRVIISADAQKASRDNYVEPKLDVEAVCADSVARLILTPEKGYRIKSAIITKKNDTCTILGQEKGANGTYVISISNFTGNTEISNISVVADKLQVYEYGTDTSTNIGAANLSETSFDSKEEMTEITNAITNKDNINAIIDTKTNEELDANKQAEAIKEIGKAVKNNRDVEIFIEINEETNLEQSKENDAKKILEEDIKKDAEEKTGSRVTDLKIAMPLNILLFAKVHGVDNVKINLKDTNKKEMIIKMKVPSTIKKEAKNIIRSYYVIRFHGEKKDTLPCIYDKENNTIKFRSNKFSNYILCYADTGATISPVPSATARPSSPITGGGTSTNISGGGSGGGSGIGGSIATPTPSTTTGKPVTTPVPVPTPAPTTAVPVATQAPTQTPTTAVPDSTAKPFGITKVTVKNAIYKITLSDSTDTRTATFMGVKKKVTKLVIPASIKAGNKTYKVVAIAKNALKGDKKIAKITIGANVAKIGKNAFNGCRKLKKIIIKSKKLTKKNVGKNAFKGIHKKAIVKVPKSKVKLYKKIIKTRGAGKKVKIKK